MFKHGKRLRITCTRGGLIDRREQRLPDFSAPVQHQDQHCFDNGRHRETNQPAECAQPSSSAGPDRRAGPALAIKHDRQKSYAHHAHERVQPQQHQQGRHYGRQRTGLQRLRPLHRDGEHRNCLRSRQPS